MKRKEIIPNLVTKTGKLVSNCKDKADLFNDFFASVFTVDNGSVPIFPEKACKSFCENIVTTPAKVRQFLKNTAPKLSAGPDNIPSIMVKKLGDQLAEPLSTMYNLSFYGGKCPKLWKMANVTPIFKKKGKRSNIEDYRPVSLTCVFSRIAEKIVRDTVVDHLNENSFLNEIQHGFVKKKGTMTQLLLSLNAWVKALDDKRNIDAAYLDFSKAFDTVSHKKLLLKLHAYGIRNNVYRWISDFLSERTQRVKISDTYSIWKPVTSGVPQGSVIGPLLFLVYVNDISAYVDASCGHKLYADDVKLYVVFDNVTECNALQNSLDAVEKWSETWQLKLQPAKSKIMHFGLHNPNFGYTMGGKNINSSNAEKDLGIMISTDLKFSHHCSMIASTASRTIGLFMKSFVNRGLDFMVKIWKIYLRPLLESNTQVWSPLYKKDIDRIEQIQRGFLKRITCIRDDTYEERLATCNLQKLSTRRICFDMALVYKIIHGLIGLSFDDFFMWHPSVRTRGHRYKIFPVQVRTDLSKNFFANRVVQRWNSLPSDIVESRSVTVFKDKMASHLAEL